jgi:hypothetical protein
MVLQRHCTDELLLAHLDGELSSRDEDALQQHLKRCWECRTRSADLDRQIQAVTAAFAEQTFPGSDRIAGSRMRFLAWQAEFERTCRRVAPPQTNPGRSRRLSRLLAGCALAAALILTLSTQWGKPAPKPGELLAKLRKSDEELARSPVHQVFRAEIQEVAPQPRSRTARLEVWTEPQRHRLAARWHDASGIFRRGVWRTEDGRACFYDSREARDAECLVDVSEKPISLVEISRAGLDADKIETRFLDWIRRRSWRPVSFLGDLRVFADGDGARLEAVRSGGFLRITAQKDSARGRMLMMVEVDERTSRPRLEVVRFESEGRIVELRLATERSETLPPHKVTPALFRPYSAPRVTPAGIPQTPSSPQVQRLSPGQVPPSAADLAALEIEAQFALHRVGACMGESIEVVRQGDRVQVHGLVADARRRNELLAALSELEGTPLAVNLNTMEEALSAAKPAYRPRTELVHAPPAELPLQEHLNRWFERDGLRIARFASEVISAADTALAQAWAVRRLQERYGNYVSQPVRAQTRWLLESMLLEHEKAVSDAVRQTRSLLQPVLAQWLPDITPELDTGGDSFGAIQRSNLLIHGLFAGADLPGQSPENAVRDLWQMLCSVHTQPVRPPIARAGSR